MKKFALVLVPLMLLALFPLTASAQEDQAVYAISISVIDMRTGEESFSLSIDLEEGLSVENAVTVAEEAVENVYQSVDTRTMLPRANGGIAPKGQVICCTDRPTTWTSMVIVHFNINQHSRTCYYQYQYRCTKCSALISTGPLTHYTLHLIGQCPLGG